MVSEDEGTKEVINKIALTKDEFEELNLNVQMCILCPATENIELHDIVGDKIADRLKATTIRDEDVTFMAVSMRYYDSSYIL